MRIIEAAFFCACWIVGACGAWAATIHVEEVAGQAWYKSATAGAAQLLGSNTQIDKGSVITNVNGSVYASPAPGSRFRLAPATELHVESNSVGKGLGERRERNAVFALTQGKMTGAISPRAEGTCCYDIRLAGGRLSVKNGTFVICIHGDGAHLYVARGFVTLYPSQGPYHEAGVRILAKANVGILSDEGQVKLEPMDRVTEGTRNCLLSGATPDILQRVEQVLPEPGNLPGNPPVSAIN
jgi:hypothetical protein